MGQVKEILAGGESRFFVDARIDFKKLARFGGKRVIVYSDKTFAILIATPDGSGKIMLLPIPPFRFAVVEEIYAMENWFNLDFTANVPKSYPSFAGANVNLKSYYPTLTLVQSLLLPAQPVANAQIAALHHDKVDFYKSDGVTIDHTVTFVTPIRADDIDLECWNVISFTDWLCVQYYNHSHGTAQAKLMMVNGKTGGVPTWEYDGDMNAYQMARNLSVSTPILSFLDGNPVFYVHDTATAHSGNYFKVNTTGGTVALSAYGLPALPNGAFTLLTDGLNTKMEDYFYRILAPRGQFLWDTVCKTSIANLGNIDYGAEGFIFPDMTAKIERRDPVTLAVLDTISLDPSAVDTTLQGISADFISHTHYSFHGSYPGAIPSGMAGFTRFLPVAGTVLVKDGVEYPLVIGYMITEYTTSLMQQPTILWVGDTPDETMYSWGTMRAVGLSITQDSTSGASVPFVPDTALFNVSYIKKRHLSWLYQWQRWISDGSTLMLQAFSWEMAQQVMTVTIQDGKPVVTLVRLSDYHWRISLQEIA